MPPPKVLEDSLLASSQLLVSLAAFGVSWLIVVSLGSLPPSPHSLLCVSVCPLLVRTPATALEVTLLHCDFILTYYICKDSSQIRLHSEVPVHVNFGETLVNPIQLGGPFCLHPALSNTCHVQGHFKPQRMHSALDSSWKSTGSSGKRRHYGCVTNVLCGLGRD